MGEFPGPGAKATIGLSSVIVLRRSPRFDFWLPVEVDELPAKLAVCHNASVNGLLLVTGSRLEPDSSVTIHIRFPPEAPEELVLAGRVARVEINHDDPEGLWPHRLAIELARPAPEIEPLLRQLERPPSSLPPPED
jgi:hypothetical protein